MRSLIHVKRVVVVLVVLIFGIAALLQAQVLSDTTAVTLDPSLTTATSTPARDPGGRGGDVGAGGPINGLTARQLEFFATGKDDFEEVEVVADGLGPRMNLDSCAACHTQPATGGTSPFVNPQVAFASKDGG